MGLILLASSPCSASSKRILRGFGVLHPFHAACLQLSGGEYTDGPVYRRACEVCSLKELRDGDSRASVIVPLRCSSAC